MRKMYKIFGAVTIIGLFLIGSMSTGLAAMSKAPAQKQSQPQYYVAVSYGDGTYVDDAIPLGPEYGSEYSYETTPYDPDPDVTPLFGAGHDLCTVFIACAPLTDIIWAYIRNIGPADCESTADVKVVVWQFMSGRLLPLFIQEETIMPVNSHRGKSVFAGPVDFTQAFHMVTVKIKLPILEYEGLIRGFNLRAGVVQDII